MSDSSVLNWLEAARSGDEIALEKLWRRFATRMRSLSEKWLAEGPASPVFDADDIRFLLLRHSESLSGRDAMKTWVAATSCGGYWRQSLFAKQPSMRGLRQLRNGVVTIKSSHSTIPTGQTPKLNRHRNRRLTFRLCWKKSVAACSKCWTTRNWKRWCCGNLRG